jgi:hypothetical protein
MFYGPTLNGEERSMSEQNLSQSSPPSIYEKIEQAHNLFETCGRSLIEDPQIHALLRKLRDCICKNCEEREGGSCCGSGIENKYDVELLLVNLLLDASLRDQQPSQNSCYFLGAKGCKLTARHVLCVNYMCQKLQKKLAREQLISLQTCAGEELDTLFILHEAIKKHIRTH